MAACRERTRHIAAASPEAVLRLLDRIDALEKALRKIATTDFTCTTRQMWMAMQGCADEALGGDP